VWAVEKSEIETTLLPPGFEGDLSLATANKHKRYGLSQKFDIGAFDNTKNTLVFQYEVRLHQGMGCSGAYFKLLRKQDEEKDLDGSTPYVRFWCF
jgi:calnexin